MKSEKKDPAYLESSFAFERYLGQIPKENLALNCSFQRCLVVNVTLSMKVNCVSFPGDCGGNTDTRTSINVDGCNVFHCL